MSAPLVTLEAIRAGFPGRAVPVLDIARLEIQPGQRVALIGPSGAGKTTMLGVLGCAIRPTAGRVLVDGADPWSLPGPALRALRRRLFSAPQTPPLPPRQRVVTAVLAGRLPQWSLGRSLASLWRASEPEIAAAALARFSLDDRLWSRVDRLSGGERQRVSLARALVSDAGAFLIDEPLSALDPTLAGQTLDVLIETAAARGATLVCSLHQVDLALELTVDEVEDTVARPDGISRAHITPLDAAVGLHDHATHLTEQVTLERCPVLARHGNAIHVGVRAARCSASARISSVQ